MKIALVLILITVVGCTLSPEQYKQVGIWYGVAQEAKSVVELTVQPDDVWLTYSEIDPKDVDCDGMSIWMMGKAEEYGADMSLAWNAIFKHNDRDDYHMAILLEGIWDYPVVIPSNGLWAIDPFIRLKEYEQATGMTLIESFQISEVE